MHVRLPALLVALAALALAPAARASTVSVEGGSLRVLAAPGETNGISVGGPNYSNSTYPVRDGGAQLSVGPGCVRDEHSGEVSCTGAGVGSVFVDAGDLDDTVTVNAPLPTTVLGGPGVDGLSFAPSGGFGAVPGATLDGGDGPDSLIGGPGNDRLLGGPGDDYASGGPGNDTVHGDLGRDTVDGGDGNDLLEVRDKKTDSALCGPGRDSIRAEVLDALDYACEVVDYGPSGRVGRLSPITGGGRFVRVPGQGASRVDRRILPDVLYLIRKYKIRLGDGYALRGHEHDGEHPLGLAVDIYPGPGGSWKKVAKLARWAEPRQNHTRLPFRWAGWNGDRNHGDPQHCRASRGCPAHLHLSWSHSRGHFGKPVRTVWVFAVTGGIAP
jgi:hypothetical protein